MSHGDFRHAAARWRASDPARNVPRETRVGGGVLRGANPERIGARRVVASVSGGKDSA